MTPDERAAPPIVTGLLNIAALSERLHRASLAVLDRQLAELNYLDLNATQAMILMHMGAEQMTVSELTSRGCYQGTNVSYNLKKLTKNGYLVQERSEHDQRLIKIRASRKGRQLQGALVPFYDALYEGLAGRGRINLSNLLASLAAIEHFLLERNVQHFSGETDVSIPGHRRSGREPPRLKLSA